MEYPNLDRLIHKLVNKYAWCGADKADLISEAYVGLQTAKERFDPTRNVKFITYAHWWIRGKVQQAADKHIRVQSGLCSIESQDSCGKTMHEKLAEAPDTSSPATQDAMSPIIDRLLCTLSVNERVILSRRFDLEHINPPSADRHAMLQESRDILAALKK
jgi:RNA polymerase sigma factor (sigma-70 family)